MKKTRFFGLLFVLAMASLSLLASCAGMAAARGGAAAPLAEHALDEHDDDHDDHDDHDDQPDYGRLLVHSLDGSLTMVDAYDGDILFTEQQALPAGSTVLYAGETGEVGYAFGLDHRRAAIVDSGYILMPHGGHHDLATNRPSLVGTFDAELVPDNFYSDGRFAYAVDRDEGRVLRLNEVSVRSFLQVPSIDTLEYERTVAASPAIDAAAAYGGELLYVLPDALLLLPASARADRMADVRRLGKTLVFPSEHGRNPLVFNVAANFLRPAAVIGLMDDYGYWLLSYNFDTKALNSRRLAVMPLQIAYDPFGTYLIMLGADYVLYSLDPQTFAIKKTLNLVDHGFIVAADDLPLAALTLGTRYGWLTNPAAPALVQVELSTLQVNATWALTAGSLPDALVLLKTVGEKH